MKYISSFILALCFTTAALVAESKETGWLTDHQSALKQAKEEKKQLLINFTGSDWCSWCKKLVKEVFTQKEFMAFAKNNLVLLEADFPQNKTQSKELKKANEALQRKYNIEGYPTLIILDSDGKQVGTMGYQPGGPGPFIDKLKSFNKPSTTK